MAEAILFAKLVGKSHEMLQIQDLKHACTAPLVPNSRQVKASNYQRTN